MLHITSLSEINKAVYNFLNNNFILIFFCALVFDFTVYMLHLHSVQTFYPN